MTSIANPTAVLDTFTKFFRLIFKQGVKMEHINAPNNSVAKRKNLAEYLKMGCPKVNNDGEVVTPQLPECRLILGDGFLSVEEVARVYGWSYSDEQLEHFTETLPDFEELMWLRSNGYMLVAGPPTEINLLEVRDLDNQLFYSKTEGWYAEDKHKFSREDKVPAGQWLKIRKDEVPNSFNKNLSEQQELVTEEEYVPNAPTVSYAVTAYYKVRGVYLLRGKYVRTSSVDADGHRVFVGDFNEDGLFVNHCWDGSRDGDLGVSSARK